MSDGDANTLTVYSRQGCHLCEILIEQLLPLLTADWRLEIVDIDRDRRLVEAYDAAVPVVEYAGREVCRYHLDKAALRQILNARVATSGASPPA